MEEIDEELYWLDIYQKYAQKCVQDTALTFIHPFAIYINYPVYHPAVFQGFKPLSKDGWCVKTCGIIVANNEHDAMEQFIKPKVNALSNPANIDAAVCYNKNNKKFWEKNREFAEAYKKHDCRICWKPLSNGEPLIYACHVNHFKCTVNAKCPVCHEPMSA